LPKRMSVAPRINFCAFVSFDLRTPLRVFLTPFCGLVDVRNSLRSFGYAKFDVMICCKSELLYGLVPERWSGMNMCQNCLAWVRNTNLAVNGERFGECHLNPLAIEKYERSWCLQFAEKETPKHEFDEKPVNLLPSDWR